MRLLLLTLACLVAGAMTDDIEDLMKLDVEPFLKDKEKWNALFDCLMDRGPCEEYQKIKDVLPEVIATNCEKCTHAQKKTYEQRMMMFANAYPKDYGELAAKYASKLE